MRPTYETQGDVDNEREVMRLLCAKWQCQFAKLPKKYALDYVLIRHDEVKAFAEVKCRTNPVGAYPTYMLALQKVIAAKELTRSTGKPSMLIVRELGRPSPAISRITVDLPEPELPTRATNSPECTSKLTLRSTSLLWLP